MWIHLAALATCACLLFSSVAGAQNVILVALDDVGIDKVSDYGFPGAGPTPNIDRLALAGVTFRNAWANRICSPSRASMLTGLHPVSTGIGTNVGIKGTNPDTSVGLDPALPNIANVLRANGYRTAAVGKWHLAGAGSVNDIIEHPNAAGFDHYSGSISGPKASVLGLTVSGYYNWEKCENGSCAISNDYMTTDSTDEAIAQLAGSEPFFLYLAYNSAHAPHHDPPNHLHDYDGQCQESPAPFSPLCHKAMVQAADREIGRLLAAIDWHDTTVILVGDNGSPPTTVQAPFKADYVKGSFYQGGINVPFIVTGEAVATSARGATSDALVGVTDIFATVMEWAGLADGTPDSVSFRTHLTDPDAPSARDVIYSETFVPNGGPPTPESHERAARGDRFKLIRPADSAIEFYDLLADPLEVMPLALATLDAEEIEAFDRLAPLVGVQTIPEPRAEAALVACLLTVVMLARLRARRG